MDKMAHIKYDLEEILYKVFEDDEENCYKHLNVTEIGEVVDIIKDLAQIMHYDRLNKTNSGTDLHTQD